MSHAGLHHAATALRLIDLCESDFASLFLTRFNLSLVSLCFELGLPCTNSAFMMLGPGLIRIFISLNLDPVVTDRAHNHKALLSIDIAWASMVSWSPMVTTESFSAILTFKWHEVTLVTLSQIAVLSYIRF